MGNPARYIASNTYIGDPGSEPHRIRASTWNHQMKGY
jgi:hypothetical protein